MGNVIWAPSALKDVNSIAEFIARDSVDQSALFVVRLFESTDRLQKFPRSGRVIPEIDNQSCREIIRGSYRIMYRLDNDDVWIAGIIHGSRDWNPK
jgi:toxin ParE1/3/4